MNYQNIQNANTSIVSAKVETIISEIYCIRSNDLIETINPITDEIVALLLESNQILKDDLNKLHPNDLAQINTILKRFQLDSVLLCFQLLEEKIIPYTKLDDVINGFHFILNTLEQTGFTTFDLYEKTIIIQNINGLISLIMNSKKESIYDYLILLNETTPFIKMNEIVPNQFI